MVPVLNVPASWVGLLMMVGAALAAAAITYVVVVLIDRHNERVLAEEYTALLEALVDEMEARLERKHEREQIVAWAQQRAFEIWEEDDSDDETLIIDEADDDDGYDDYVVAKIEPISTLIETILDYLDLLAEHPDAVGADSVPRLRTIVDALCAEEYDLRTELAF